MLTIFTPTYNRANLLPNLYDSLIKQTCYEFEWLIVDDGSADNTEFIIKEIKKDKSPFKIRYLKKEHGGKHRAINYALDYAEGDYFFIVDSDDTLINDAVQHVIEWTDEIKDIPKIAGVSGLKVLPNGVPTSGSPKFDGALYIDASNFEREQYNLGGDQAEIFKTSILKENRFPDFEGEVFLEEAVVWNRLAELGYLVRWYQHPIYKCDYLQNGLTKTRNRWRILDNFYGYAEHFRLLIHYGEKEQAQSSLFYFWWASNKRHISIRERCDLINISKKQYVIMMIRSVPLFCLKKVVRRKRGSRWKKELK